MPFPVVIPAALGLGSIVARLTASASGFGAAAFALAFLIAPLVIDFFKSIGVGFVAYFALTTVGDLLTGHIFAQIALIPPEYMPYINYLRLNEAISIMLSGVASGLALRSIQTSRTSTRGRLVA
jgi:hypothetical protein